MLDARRILKYRKPPVLFTTVCGVLRHNSLNAIERITSLFAHWTNKNTEMTWEVNA